MVKKKVVLRKAREQMHPLYAVGRICDYYHKWSLEKEKHEQKGGFLDRV